MYLTGELAFGLGMTLYDDLGQALDSVMECDTETGYCLVARKAPDGRYLSSGDSVLLGWHDYPAPLKVVVDDSGIEVTDLQQIEYLKRSAAGRRSDARKWEALRQEQEAAFDALADIKERLCFERIRGKWHIHWLD